MIVRQIETGQMDNFSYLVGCEKRRKALVIDPGIPMEPILAAAEAEGLAIELIVNTHGHGDHTVGNAALQAATGAKVAIHALEADRCPVVDLRIEDGMDIRVGDLALRVIHTPGHTPGGVCLYGGGNLFTGDTLFVGDSGRTDLPGGHRPTLGASIRRLMALPDDTVVWPGHDYGPSPSSTIGWEKRHNVNAEEYGYKVRDGRKASGRTQGAGRGPGEG
jgi:glyoxylase-like metal-dependent hydrolase (beta-lactamase superfamily II)